MRPKQNSCHRNGSSCLYIFFVIFLVYLTRGGSDPVGGLLFSVAPIGIMLKNLGLSLVGEGNAAGVEHRSGGLIPGAVLVVADQWKAPAGELDTNLMAAAGVKPNMNQ